MQNSKKLNRNIKHLSPVCTNGLLKLQQQNPAIPVSPELKKQIVIVNRIFRKTCSNPNEFCTIKPGYSFLTPTGRKLIQKTCKKSGLNSTPTIEVLVLSLYNDINNNIIDSAGKIINPTTNSTFSTFLPFAQTLQNAKLVNQTLQKHLADAKTNSRG